jgi:hypothetical protein
MDPNTQALLAALTPGKDASHVSGLSGDFQGRLSRMFSEMPPELRGQMRINSGARSVERQAQLYADAVRKYGSPTAARKWVAPPGRSRHNHGVAADLHYGNDAVREWAHQNASKYGLRFPMGHEPWHVEPDNARGAVDPNNAGTMMAQNVKQRIGTGTAGGVMPAAPGMDRLKAALGGGYDPRRLEMAEDMLASGEAMAPKSRNWMDALSSALQTGFGAYEKYKEGGKKKAYDEEMRAGFANASDATAIARLLMASPDQATALKGAEMFGTIEAKAKQNQASFGKSPTIARGKDGKLVALQFNDKGEAIEVPLPEGVELSEKLMSVDTATGTRLVGGTSHQTVADVPKQLADAEAEKKRGELQEIGRHALPAVESRTNRLMQRLDKLGNSKMREAFTGYSGYLPNWSPEAKDYEGLQKEIEGNTFLAGFGELRGGGAITETEGLKAQAAYSRLQTLAPSDAGYGEAIADFKEVLEEIRNNARLRAGLEPAPRGPTAGGAETSPGAAGGFKVLRVR